MAIRWQPAYRPLNSFSTIDREFDRLSRQLAWALRNADLNFDRASQINSQNKIKQAPKSTDQTAKELANKPVAKQAPISWRPVVELTDTSKNIELRFFLPGVTAENVDIQVTKATVTVSGDRPAPDRNADQKVWSEFRYGRFSRTVKLPVAIVNNQAKAEFSNGALTLTLPKVANVIDPVFKLTLGDSVNQSKTESLHLEPTDHVDRPEPEVNLPKTPAAPEQAEPASDAEKTWAA